jgi:hypothetical protein
MPRPVMDLVMNDTATKPDCQLASYGGAIILTENERAVYSPGFSRVQISVCACDVGV